MALLPEKLLEPISIDKVRSMEVKNDNGDKTTLYYYDYQTIVNLLNEHLGLNWSYQIKQVEVSDPSAVAVHARLEIDLNGTKTCREQFGTAFVKNGASYAEKLKAAASAGLTRCAALYGIGAELYDPEHHLKIEAHRNGLQDKLQNVKDQVANIAKMRKLSTDKVKEIFGNILNIPMDTFVWKERSLADYEKLLVYLRAEF